MATMPSAEAIARDIEARTTWRVRIYSAWKEWQEFKNVLQLERRIRGGVYRGKKVTTYVNLRRYFKADMDYETALARLLAEVETSYADALEKGDSEADDGNTNAVA